MMIFPKERSKRTREQSFILELVAGEEAEEAEEERKRAMMRARMRPRD